MGEKISKKSHTFESQWAPCSEVEKSQPSLSSAPQFPTQMYQSAANRWNRKCWLMRDHTKENRTGGLVNKINRSSSKINLKVENLKKGKKSRLWQQWLLVKLETTETLSHFPPWTSFPFNRKHTVEKKWSNNKSVDKIYSTLDWVLSSIKYVSTWNFDLARLLGLQSEDG